MLGGIFFFFTYLGHCFWDSNMKVGFQSRIRNYWEDYRLSTSLATHHSGTQAVKNHRIIIKTIIYIFEKYGWIAAAGHGVKGGLVIVIQGVRTFVR